MKDNIQNTPEVEPVEPTPTPEEPKRVVPFGGFTMQEYVDYIRLQVTGGLLELEIDDATIEKFVRAALVELRRYIDQTNVIQVPFSKCIDLDEVGKKAKEETGCEFNCSAVVGVYRTEGFTGDSSSTSAGSSIDPMYAQQWMAFSNGGMAHSLNNYVMNYMAYNTLLQMRNTTNTDLAFKEDKTNRKLYINCNYDYPKEVTIEYIPVFKEPEEITSDYWIDILKRLSLGMVKVALGRIRSRFTQSNALWTQDGETMLSEGNEELKDLREVLRVNSTYFFPRD